MNPRFNLKFYQAWRAKGVFREARQWSDYKPSDDTPILTVWHTVISEGLSEVVEDPKTGHLLMMVPPGKWVNTDKGKLYMSLVQECYAQNKAAEVILLCGRRSETEAHEVYATAIEDSLYYVRFTKIRDDGFIRGVFLPK